jgi:hypothetical protein
MGEPVQRLQALFDYGVGRSAIHAADQADAAGIMLESGII